MVGIWGNALLVLQSENRCGSCICVDTSACIRVWLCVSVSGCVCPRVHASIYNDFLSAGGTILLAPIWIDACMGDVSLHEWMYR